MSASTTSQSTPVSVGPANPPPGPYAKEHAKPQGPGDARPSAMQIVKDQGLEGKLSGKTILITGCSSGLGVETARALHATGADIYITARDNAKGSEVVKDLLSKSSGKGKLELLHCDLNSLDSVRQCAKDFLAKTNKLNILILNAGVMACPEGKTKDGFETQIGTNHFAHFLLFQLLKDALLKSSTPQFPSRLVALTSWGHNFGVPDVNDLNFEKRPYHLWQSYGQSKTANIWHALEAERRYGSKGLHAFAVHPGCIIVTDLMRHLSPDDWAKFDTPETRATFKNPEQGAATSVWAAIGKELEGKGGFYLEDVSISTPAAPERVLSGYQPHAYDTEGAQKLWHASNTAVALPVEA